MAGIKAKSVDTSIVENRLRSSEPGDIITYAEMSKLLGRDVRQFCRCSIATARNTLIRESIFFDTISGIGLKRLTNEEACKTTAHYVARSRSAVRRGLKHIRHVPYESLTTEAKRDHLTISTQLAMIDMFASSKAEKRIAGAVSGEKPLAIGDTLKLFGG